VEEVVVLNELAAAIQDEKGFFSRPGIDGRDGPVLWSTMRVEVLSLRALSKYE